MAAETAHTAPVTAGETLPPAAAASGTGDVDVAAIRTLVDAWEAHPSNLAAYEIAKRGRALLAEVARLRELTQACTCCDGNPTNYDGPQADCAVHGAIRAFNEASRDLAEARAALAAEQASHNNTRTQLAEAWARLANSLPVGTTGSGSVSYRQTLSNRTTPKEADRG